MYLHLNTDDHPELDDIFSIDSATGILTVDATGPNLVVEGVTLGTLTVSDKGQYYNRLYM